MSRLRYSGDDIRRVRKASNMTQAEFARHMGVVRRTVMRWERQGVDCWTNHAFELTRFEELEQLELPL